MRLILCTAPEEAAGAIAKTVVEEKLAACVNITPAVTSVYVWEGKLEEDTEAMMFIKTTAAKVNSLAARIKALHPYDVPEIITLNINTDEGNPDYLKWVGESVG